MNREDFVTFEQAEKFDKLAFKVYNCDYYYTTQEQVIGNNPYFYTLVGIGELIGAIDIDEHNEDSLIEAPMLWQVQKYLRDNGYFEIGIEPIRTMADNGNHQILYKVTLYQTDGCTLEEKYSDLLETYEYALSSAIDKALDLLLSLGGEEKDVFK